MVFIFHKKVWVQEFWEGGVFGRVLGGMRACTVSTRKTLIKLISLAIFLPFPRTLVWPSIGKIPRTLVWPISFLLSFALAKASQLLVTLFPRYMTSFFHGLSLCLSVGLAKVSQLLVALFPGYVTNISIRFASASKGWPFSI